MSNNLNYHHKIEKSIFLLLSFIVIVASIGGIVEVLPLFKKEIAVEKVDGMRAYTPLELIGFNIYKREGCYNCHSQQIRPLRDEVERYGHYSLAAESIYDHPFAWGSKRTGPDLARIGGKYSNDWHIQHLYDPRSLVSGSIMPSYPFLLNQRLDSSEVCRQMIILQSLDVPYSPDDIKNCQKDIATQLSLNKDQSDIDDFINRYKKVTISKFNNKRKEPTEMDALVAYLQSLGNKVDFDSNQGRDW